MYSDKTWAIIICKNTEQRDMSKAKSETKHGFGDIFGFFFRKV